MGIAEEEAELIKMASTLHDIGKVSVPDSILLKPGKLTREEFEIMKKHTTVGHDILVNSNKKILRVAAEISLEHHEKFDGTGYPKGLLGQEISLKSRIIALVDVFDALGTDRVYKKKWALPEILAYLEEQRGKHFDPQILDMFFKSMDEIIEIRDRLED
jgi:response regulator RpfG family c-di-GMP phosphodiesterase